jgi:cytochrome c peroxidase
MRSLRAIPFFLLALLICAYALNGANIAGADNDAVMTAANNQTGSVTAVYMTLVNSGKSPEVLTGAVADISSEVSLRDAFQDDTVGIPTAVEVTLNPHTRVDLNPSTQYFKLTNIEAMLNEGDTFSLTLVFLSGKRIPVEVAVRQSAPTERINFVVEDTFQISNAWAYPTSTDALVVSGYNWNLPSHFPMPRVPADNPMTAEKVVLGRQLFYDTRLSGNGTTSCGTCHRQELAFTDGRTLAVGSTGEVHPRNSMSLTNSAYSSTLTWANPALATLEQQIPVPMFGEFPIELGITGNEDEVLARFRSDPLYQQLFVDAFPDDADPYNFSNINKAIASFTRTLISSNSPYDRYIAGDATALSESARRGMDIFFSERLECNHCHSGFNLSLSTVSANTTFFENPFFNTGLYNIDGTGTYPTNNQGLFEITGRPEDMGRFRPPTLRNIALTAPYMHDGSIPTLEEVIRFYESGGRNITDGEFIGDGRSNPYKSGFIPGFTLTDQERLDVINFLMSLTDEQFITDPALSDPFEHQ